jgi:hypothetical protein
MKIEYKLFIVTILMLACVSIPLHAQQDDLLASNDEGHFIVLEPSYTTTKINTKFEKKYHYLVARSYFKLLAEAQRSERKLKLQYDNFTFENQKYNREGSRTFQNKLNNAHKKYKLHRAMLEGLKSWNLFSDDRTGDMFYFMAENEERIFKMYSKEVKEEKMIKYLIYKLADLYHLEE